MKGLRIIGPVTLVTAALLAAAGPAPSVHAQDRTATPGVQPSGSSPSARLGEIAEALATRWRSRLVVDPEVQPQALPRLTDGAATLDEALTSLCASMPGTTWRRVYLLEKHDTTSWTAGRLGAAARALERLELESLVIDRDAGRSGAWFRKGGLAGAERESWVRDHALNPEPLYLIYSTTSDSDGRPPVDQLADLQRQQLDAAGNEQNGAVAYGQMIQLLRSLPPQEMQAFAERTLQAGSRLWDMVPQEQRGEMIQRSAGLMQGAVAPEAGPRPEAARRPRGAAPRSHLLELRSVAAELGRRYDAAFVVDPSLVLRTAPVTPASRLPVEQALEALTRPHKGIAWRRVRLPEGEHRLLGRERFIQRLVASVRSLDTLPPGIGVEDAASGKWATYVKSGPVAGEGDQPASSIRPVYVLYAPFAPAGGSLEEQFLRLQRRQMGLMLRMDPDQMAQSMERLVQTYHASDPAARTGIAGLPLMAGMMAVWFPRYAKEQGR